MYLGYTLLQEIFYSWTSLRINNLKCWNNKNQREQDKGEGGSQKKKNKVKVIFHEMSIPNTAKTHQVKIKDKIFLQFLSCINSLSFRKDLKHLYLFTEERFWPVTIQLCAFRAYIFPFQNLLYYFLKQLSFSRWKKEKKKKKTTIVWHFAPQCAISQKC